MLRRRTSVAREHHVFMQVAPSSDSAAKPRTAIHFSEWFKPTFSKDIEALRRDLHRRKEGAERRPKQRPTSAFEKNSRHSSAEGRFRASLESIRESSRRRP